MWYGWMWYGWMWYGWMWYGWMWRPPNRSYISATAFTSA